MAATGRRVFAEFLGSLLLTALVVGSGIAAQTLSPGDDGLQLLENALATALGLFVLIAVFAHISGAHFNPVVSLADAAMGFRPWREVAAYIPAQIVGCIAGAILANAMFGLPAAAWSSTDRLTGPHFLAEVVATAGLVLGDLLAGSIREGPPLLRRRSRPTSGRLLLHELDELREPRHQDRPDAQRHVRRHRSVISARDTSGGRWSEEHSACWSSDTCTRSDSRTSRWRQRELI